MRIGRAAIWVYPIVVTAVGVGFLIWSFSQSGAVNAYRNAPPCGEKVTTTCYQQVPGQITSVQVSQGRQGESDDVTIRTDSLGTLSATLKPSAAAAPHIRTGSQVTVKVYGGQVTLVRVDGFNIASTANPAAGQGDLSFAGWIFVAFGVASVAIPILASRRRRGAPAHVPGSESELQQEILPSGEIGWLVHPQLSLGMFGRYVFVAALVLLLSLRALLDPAKTLWAITLDLIVIGGTFGLVALHAHNSCVFADKQQIGKTNLFGRTTRLPLQDVQRAERFSVPNRSGVNRHLVFVRSDGRMAFEVAGPSWDFARLGRLCSGAGVTLTGSYDDLVGAFKLNQRVPGMTKWGQQAVLLLGIFALIAAYVLLIGVPGSR